MASLEGNNLVVFHYLSVFEIWSLVGVAISEGRGYCSDNKEKMMVIIIKYRALFFPPIIIDGVDKSSVVNIVLCFSPIIIDGVK